MQFAGVELPPDANVPTLRILAMSALLKRTGFDYTQSSAIGILKRAAAASAAFAPSLMNGASIR